MRMRLLSGMFVIKMKELETLYLTILQVGRRFLRFVPAGVHPYRGRPLRRAGVGVRAHPAFAALLRGRVRRGGRGPGPARDEALGLVLVRGGQLPDPLRDRSLGE